MVVWLTELATGPHDMADGLTIVAGGGGGALDPGRYVRFAQNRPSPCRSYGCQSGARSVPGQSHLFVSAMQAMGMPDDSFGQTPRHGPGRVDNRHDRPAPAAVSG